MKRKRCEDKGENRIIQLITQLPLTINMNFPSDDLRSLSEIAIMVASLTLTLKIK
jgi:hypothetical protein